MRPSRAAEACIVMENSPATAVYGTEWERMKCAAVVIAGALIAATQLSGQAADPKANGPEPNRVYVPTGKVATEIADAIAVSLYGEPGVAALRPLHAKLKDGLWIVRSVQSCPEPCIINFQISRATGEVTAPGRPAAGWVSRPEAAIRIARAVLIPVIGEKAVRSEEPLQAISNGDNWEVSTTPKCAPGCRGGGFGVIIAKDSAQILRLAGYR